MTAEDLDFEVFENSVNKLVRLHWAEVILLGIMIVIIFSTVAQFASSLLFDFLFFNSRDLAVKAYVINTLSVVTLTLLVPIHSRKGDKLRDMYEKLKEEYRSLDKNNDDLRERFRNMLTLYLNNGKPKLAKYAFSIYMWVSVSIICAVTPVIYHYL